uniref:HORMA domain-containing protein n=1 Tax=Rhabditophanes sp. KR3021 TaxID=114890 RepID=A0AC35TN12_9BILA
MKVQKKVLDMNQDELDLVFIAIFGYKYSKLSLEEMQEEVIKWLIAKKLSLQHHFIFYEDSDEMPIHRYLLTKNNEMPCKCCENISMTYGEYKKTVHSKNDLTNSESYEFLFEELRLKMTELGIEDGMPDAFITDKEPAAIKVINSTYPNTLIVSFILLRVSSEN